MAAGKWIGGFLGFITAGPLGALAGFALGSLFDHGLDEVNKPGSEGHNNREYSNAYEAYSGYGSGGYGNGSSPAPTPANRTGPANDLSQQCKSQ